jgi:hypothetical protein
MMGLPYFHYLDLTRYILQYLEFYSLYQLYECFAVANENVDGKLAKQREKYQAGLNNILQSITSVYCGYCNPILSLVRAERGFPERLFDPRTSRIQFFLSSVVSQLKRIVLFFPSDPRRNSYFPMACPDDFEFIFGAVLADTAVSHSGSSKKRNNDQKKNSVFPQLTHFIIGVEYGFNFQHPFSINEILYKNFQQNNTIHALQYLCLDYEDPQFYYEKSLEDWILYDPSLDSSSFSLVKALHDYCPHLKRADISRQLTIHDYYQLLSPDFQWKSLEELEFYSLYKRLRNLIHQSICASEDEKWSSLQQRHSHLWKVFDESYYSDENGNPVLIDEEEDGEPTSIPSNDVMDSQRTVAVVDLLSLLLSNYKFPNVKKLEIIVDGETKLFHLFQLIFHCFVWKASYQPFRNSLKMETVHSTTRNNSSKKKEKEFVGKQVSRLLIDSSTKESLDKLDSRLNLLFAKGSVAKGSSSYLDNDDDEAEFMDFPFSNFLEQGWRSLFLPQSPQDQQRRSGDHQSYPLLSNPMIEKFCLFPNLQEVFLGKDIPVSYFMFLFNQKNPSLESREQSQKKSENKEQYYEEDEENTKEQDRDEEMDEKEEEIIQSNSSPFSIILCHGLCSEFLTFLTNLYPSQRWNISGIQVYYDLNNAQRSSSFLTGASRYISVGRSHLPSNNNFNNMTALEEESNCQKATNEQEEGKDSSNVTDDIYSLCADSAHEVHSFNYRNSSNYSSEDEMHFQQLYVDPAFMINTSNMTARSDQECDVLIRSKKCKEITKKVHISFQEYSDKFSQCLTENNSVDYLQSLQLPILYFHSEFIEKISELLSRKMKDGECFTLGLSYSLYASAFSYENQLLSRCLLAMLQRYSKSCSKNGNREEIKLVIVIECVSYSKWKYLKNNASNEFPEVLEVAHSSQVEIVFTFFSEAYRIIPE